MRLLERLLPHADALAGLLTIQAARTSRPMPSTESLAGELPAPLEMPDEDDDMNGDALDTEL